MRSNNRNYVLINISKNHSEGGEKNQESLLHQGTMGQLICIACIPEKWRCALQHLPPAQPSSTPRLQTQWGMTVSVFDISPLTLDHTGKEAYLKQPKTKNKVNSHHCVDRKHAWRGESQECPRRSNQCLSARWGHPCTQSEGCNRWRRSEQENLTNFNTKDTDTL